MEKADFASFVTDVCNYFERKPPSDATFSLWFDQVHNIPAIELHEIKRAICEFEKMPHNLPAMIWAKHYDGKNGGKPRQEKCECHNGFWEVAQYRKELGEWAIYRFFCATCNDRDKGIFTRDDLQAVNYRILQGQMDREPQRFMVQPTGKILISNDPDSIKFMADQLRAHMAEVRKGRPEPTGITYDDLPF